MMDFNNGNKNFTFANMTNITYLIYKILPSCNTTTLVLETNTNIYLFRGFEIKIWKSYLK